MCVYLISVWRGIHVSLWNQTRAYLVYCDTANRMHLHVHFFFFVVKYCSKYFPMRYRHTNMYASNSYLTFIFYYKTKFKNQCFVSTSLLEDIWHKVNFIVSDIVHSSVLYIILYMGIVLNQWHIQLFLYLNSGNADVDNHIVYTYT